MNAKRSKIPWRNRNATGWWVYGELDYWVSNQRRRLRPKNRCPVGENTRVIKARSREEAYAKILRLASQMFPSKTDGGEWRFKGISFLLPIYEKLEDGAEIIWDDHGSISFGRLCRMAKAKRDLPVFDDTDQ